MNNNAKRITRATADTLIGWAQEVCDDPSRESSIMKGGGDTGGPMVKTLNSRVIENVRISREAIKKCNEKNVLLYDFFFLGRDNKKLKEKYGNFFSSNEKTVEKSHESGHFITLDHNPSNSSIAYKILDLVKENNTSDSKISEEKLIEKAIKILNSQSLDFITVEENKKIDDSGFKSSGTKEQRDALCSEKISLTDVWLTPQHIIDQFFQTSGLDKKECYDPCASDGRWLSGEGMSGDILPMNNKVLEQDFLALNSLPEKIKKIVGNIPFSLTEEFVHKAFELRGEAFYLVNGDTIMNKFNGHIKKIWIINGIEGNQKDFRSRCEFDTIILKKSALWCCIVHVTKEEQEMFTIEKDITNEQKRDGYHVALGRNTYIKSKVPVEQNEKITRLQTKGTIKYK